MNPTAFPWKRIMLLWLLFFPSSNWRSWYVRWFIKSASQQFSRPCYRKWQPALVPFSDVFLHKNGICECARHTEVFEMWSASLATDCSLPVWKNWKKLVLLFVRSPEFSTGQLLDVPHGSVIPEASLFTLSWRPGCLHTPWQTDLLQRSTIHGGTHLQHSYVLSETGATPSKESPKNPWIPTLAHLFCQEPTSLPPPASTFGESTINSSLLMPALHWMHASLLVG